MGAKRTYFEGVCVAGPLPCGGGLRDRDHASLLLLVDVFLDPGVIGPVLRRILAVGCIFDHLSVIKSIKSI